MTYRTAFCLFGSCDNCSSTLTNLQTYLPDWQQFDFFGNNLKPCSADNFPFIDLQHQQIQQEIQDLLCNLQQQGWQPHNVLGNTFIQMMYSLSYVAAQVREYQEKNNVEYDHFVFQHWNARYSSHVDITSYVPDNVLSNHSLGANRFSQLWMMLDKQAFLTLESLFTEVLKLSADPGRYWFIPGELVFLFLESHGLRFDRTWHHMHLANFKIIPTGISLS